MYKIGGKEYKLKERYSLKTWGMILKLISSNTNQDVIISLLADDKLKELLNLILDREIDGELYEEDVEAITCAIKDFFSRENSLMKNIKSSSPG